MAAGQMNEDQVAEHLIALADRFVTAVESLATSLEVLSKRGSADRPIYTVDKGKPGGPY